MKIDHIRVSRFNVAELVESFYSAMNDDFNAPILVANLFEAVKNINTVKDGNATISADDAKLLLTEMESFVHDVLGLQKETEGGSDRLSPVMDLVIELRAQARENKDWGTSDKIRDMLAAAGITIKDSKDGSTWN